MRTCILVMVVALLVIPMIAQEPFNLSETAELSDTPRMAFDSDGNLHVIWTENALRDSGAGQAHRVRTPDGTWSEMTDLTVPFALWVRGSGRLAPRSDGAMCVTMTARTSNSQLLAPWQQCYLDGVWSEEERVGDVRGQVFAEPVYDGETLQIVHFRPNNVFFGETELSGEPNALNPHFVIDADGIYHVTYLEQDEPAAIVHHISEDGGDTWSDAEVVTGDFAVSTGTHALVAGQDGEVHLVFDSEQGVRYRQWTATEGWRIAEFAQQDAPTSESTSLGLAAGADGVVHVAWAGLDGWFYTQRVDGEWTTPEQVFDGENTGAGPVLAVDETGVHMIYQDESGDRDLFYIQH